MGLVVEVTSPLYINVIIDLLHDRFFSVDEVRFDEMASEVRIPFTYTASIPMEGKRLFPRYARSSARGLLTILQASALSINDTERVQDYDFNVIEYDGAGVISVKTGIPLGMRVAVASFSVRVVLDDPSPG
jgi:hypothetical protein